MQDLRQPRHQPDLGRAAAARGAGAGAGAASRGAAARRAALGPGPEAQEGHADRAQAAAARHRHHLRLRHARPGGGADHVGPDRRDEPGQGPPGRQPARDLRPPGRALRRGLHRRGQHAQGRADAGRGRPRPGQARGWDRGAGADSRRCAAAAARSPWSCGRSTRSLDGGQGGAGAGGRGRECRLRRHGHPVSSAARGRRAIRRAPSEHPRRRRRPWDRRHGSAC